MIELRDAHVVLTGASRGLGAVMAETLAVEGARLTLAARSPAELEQTAERVRGRGGRAAVVVADVADPADRERLVTQARQALGPVDVLVNNAGIEVTARFVDLDPAEVERVVAVNLTAPLLLTHLVLPEMLERGRGHVVNIASAAGKSGPPFESVYGATKAGLVRATESLRAELVGTGVSLSVICPGFVAREGMYARMEQLAGIRASRLVGVTTPEKVAGAVVRALRRDSAELIVNQRPLRPLLALAELAPSLRRPIGNRFVFAQLQEVARHHSPPERHPG